MEDALRRCLAEDVAVPSLPLVQWVVTGIWPNWQLRVDVAFAAPGAAPLL